MLGGFLLIGVCASAAKKGLMAADIVGGILFGIVPVVAGIFLLRSSYKNKKRIQETKERALKEEKEHEIIRLAQRKKGRLTVTEVAGETSLDIVEAEKILREMAIRGYAGIKVTESGMVVYEFYEIASNDKDSAKGF
jgi:hypothetical protein